MAIEISEDRMSLTIDGAEIGTASRIGVRWTVSTWPEALSYNEAIMPLTLVKRRWHRGHSRCQPGAWRGARIGTCPGQRLTRPGARRLLRTAHVVDQDRRHDGSIGYRADRELHSVVYGTLRSA
jgi:hypothetical protein